MLLCHDTHPYGSHRANRSAIGGYATRGVASSRATNDMTAIRHYVVLCTRAHFPDVVLLWNSMSLEDAKEGEKDLHVM